MLNFIFRQNCLRVNCTCSWSSRKCLQESEYYKCSIITWDSTNMMKWLSSTSVFFNSYSASFANNLIFIDRFNHLETRLKVVYVRFNFLKVIRLWLSSAHHTTIFGLSGAFTQVTNGKITRMTRKFFSNTRTIIESSVEFSARNGRIASGYAYEKKGQGTCADKMPLCYLGDHDDREDLVLLVDRGDLVLQGDPGDLGQRKHMWKSSLVFQR